MNETEFKRRTKQLALRSIKLVESLPKSQTANVLGKQLLRSATSVGANYRAVCRAKSTADMINKMRIVEEEADESMYWIELLVESGHVKQELVAELADEFNQVVAMVVSSQKSLRSNNNPKSKIKNPK